MKVYHFYTLKALWDGKGKKAAIMKKVYCKAKERQ